MVTLLALVGCGPLPSGDDARPDIVLVSIDSLRADHLSSYGYHRPTSPQLDDLAASGLRFTQARAASPWTLPSHMTMLTGLWPTEHQVIEDDLALAPSVPIVTEALSRAGYATAAFVSTVYVSGGYGFARGFDLYQDYGITERENLAHAVRVNQVVDDAVKWVQENGKDKPVFLFVHIYDVHYPYFPPAPWDAKFDRAGQPDELRYRNYKFYQKHPLNKRRMAHQVAQYDESIAWVDAELGRLVEAWDDSRRPAYWIVTADHGEELGERGSWGHGHTLYREALEIPLIVAGPGIAEGVRDERVGTIDIATTIAGMAGITFPKGPGVDLRGAVPERTFYAETSRFDSARLSIEQGRKRLDVDLAGDARALFDLRTDPKEKTPLEGGEELEAALFSALGLGWTTEASARTSGWMWLPGGRPVKGLPEAENAGGRGAAAGVPDLGTGALPGQGPGGPGKGTAGTKDDERGGVEPVGAAPGVAPGGVEAVGAAPGAEPGGVEAVGSAPAPPSVPLPAPLTFGVYPPDAEVSAAGVTVRGVLDAPADGPLRYAGPRHVVGMSLDDETRKQLEALGYVQGPEE